MSDLGIVADRRIINDLNRFKAGPIVELDEPDRSVITIGTNPTFEINGIGLRDIFFAREVGIERLDSNGFWLHEGETLSVTTSDGIIKAKNLLLATGLGFYKPRTMGLPNEEKYSNILYTLKDFNFLKGKKVVIFGGGDSALDWAKEISQISSFVSLVHRRTEFRGNPDTIKGRPVTLYLPYIPHALIESNEKLVGITIEEVNDHHLINLEADYVLVNYGAVPSPSLLGLKPGPTFGALVNEHCEAEPHAL